MEEREKLSTEVYKQAKLAGVTGVVSQSGIAKQWDFEATDVELSDMAKVIERAEIELTRIFGNWTGESFEAAVNYPEDFGILDIDADIEQADAFLSIGGWPHSVELEVRRKLVIGYFKDIDPDKRDELIKDVEEMSEDALHSGGSDDGGGGDDGGDGE
jgi:hypothetical protein